MTTIEDRLRAATRAAADTVENESQPPLRLPAQAPGLRMPQLRFGAPRLMASLAAAVAMVAVVTTVVATRGVVSGSRAAGESDAGAALAAAPPFFVATVSPKKSLGDLGGTEAVVGRTATGKILAAVRPPAPYNSFLAVSAASSDRTFVLAAQKIPVGRHWISLRPIPTRFFLLRLHPGRRHPATLSPLPIPVLRGILSPSQLAVSPSGTSLAVQRDVTDQGPSILQVYSLASGKSKRWVLPARSKTGSPGIAAPAWDGGDRFLTALVYAKNLASCKSGCLRLLDTTRGGSQGGSNILTSSKIVFRTTRIHRLIAWDSALVTPDGSRVLLTGLAGKRLRKGVETFNLPLLYDITLPSGRIKSTLTGSLDGNFIPLWASNGAQLEIIGQIRKDIMSATLRGRHSVALLPIPSDTVQVAF
jgi:hypothetical protein